MFSINDKGLIGIYSFHIITLGCRVNQYESRAIAEKLTDMGLTESADLKGCDLYVVNTCAVTEESSRKSRQMARRAAASAVDPVVVVTGCWSEIEPEKARALGCADVICGSGDKLSVCEKALAVLEEKRNKKRSAPVETFSGTDKYDEYVRRRPENVREYLKIEDGCNGKCAYCVIPKARGAARSRDPEEAVREAKRLVENGAKELTVTGIEISGYQHNLPDLLMRISAIEGLERIRLGSLDPSMMTEALVGELSVIPKLAPHFHLSIQSGCSRILAAMRRKYNAEQAAAAAERIRGSFPRAMLTCDLIVGFPGETDSDFAETLSFMKNARFLHAHIFPFSPRPGTEAAGMPGQLPKSIKEERLHEVESLQKKITESILSVVIKDRRPLPVLAEKYENGFVCGHSDSYIEVIAPHDRDVTGSIVNITPIAFDGETVAGIIE